jgi:outer membrane protein TolC
MGLASIFFLLGINPTWAAPLSTAAQVMQVLRVHAPEIIEANQMQNAAEANIRRARQIPNPQISVSGGYGKYLGDTVVNGQADLTFVIETGGKRIYEFEKQKESGKGRSRSELRQKKMFC